MPSKNKVSKKDNKQKDLPPSKKQLKGRAKRIAQKKEPKLVENVKTGMFIRGPKTSELINKVLLNFYLLKKPNGVQLKKRNDIRPFEDVSKLEFLSKQNDASLFMEGSHNKKR